jgi:indolepyruvate ferredoxin oxidoreductase alpha subunit
MAPLLDAARENANVKVFILDNSIVAMTGGQPTQATDEQMVELVAGLGVPRGHIRLVEPTQRKLDETVGVIREELAYEGLSVIIARRSCVTYAKEIKAYRRGETGAI